MILAAQVEVAATIEAEVPTVGVEVVATTEGRPDGALAYAGRESVENTYSTERIAAIPTAKASDLVRVILFMISVVIIPRTVELF